MAQFFEVDLPQSDGVSFSFTTNLDGSVFGFEFKFNARMSCWTINLLDSANEPIYCGIKGVADYDLLKHCSDSRRPAGKLYLVDTSGQKTDPGAFDIGKRVRLVYRSEESV